MVCISLSIQYIAIHYDDTTVVILRASRERSQNDTYDLCITHIGKHTTGK